MISAAFWLVAAIAIEWISPKPLPAYIIAGALVPVLIVGAAMHWRRYRSGESWRRSAYDRSARRSNPSSRPLPGGAETKDQSSARADAAS
jgi:fatty acid desaturase